MTREEAIELLCAYGVPQDEKRFQEAIDMAITALSNQQKWIDEEMQNYIIEQADLVPCKDCKFFDPDGANTEGWGWCNKNDSDWRVDDFCSWGKRGKR